MNDLYKSTQMHRIQVPSSPIWNEIATAEILGTLFVYLLIPAKTARHKPRHDTLTQFLKSHTPLLDFWDTEFFEFNSLVILRAVIRPRFLDGPSTDYALASKGLNFAFEDNSELS